MVLNTKESFVTEEHFGNSEFIVEFPFIKRYFKVFFTFFLLSILAKFGNQNPKAKENEN